MSWSTHNLVETHSGQHWRRHIDHLKSVGTNVSQASKDKSHADDTDGIEIIPTFPTELNGSAEESSTIPTDTSPLFTGRRYPQREHRPLL